MMATPSPTSTDSWFLDSGATHHLSHTAANIHNGTDSVMVGNGKSLPITQVGHSFLHTSAKPFVLHNLLHVPQLTSNLISVSKFCTEMIPFLNFIILHFLSRTRISKWLSSKANLNVDSTNFLPHLSAHLLLVLNIKCFSQKLSPLLCCGINDLATLLL